jgi:choline dehydrogenase-like flavoprotein
MIVDANTLETNSVIKADICIIGGGPCGITLAHRLMGSGLKIVLVESGGLKRSAAAESLNSGGQASGKYAPLNMYRRRIFGGASTIWGGRLVPYDPIDFEPRDWAPNARWPIGYEAVAPYYADATTYAEGGDNAYDAKDALDALPPLIDGFDNEAVRTTSLERFSPPTHFGRTYRDALAAASDATILMHASCVRLAPAGDGGAVQRAELRTLSDGALSVEASRFVVACGGIETFRLLAASRDAARDRFGGEAGPLGRYFMSHIEGNFPRLVLDRPSRGVQWGFVKTRDGMYARRRFTISAEAARQRRLLNFVARLHHSSAADPRHGDPVLSGMYLAKAFILPEYRRKISMVERTAAANAPQGAAFWLGHFGNLALRAPQFVAFMTDWSAKRYMAYRRIPYVVLPSRTGIYPLDFNAEQLPNPESRVFETSEKDRFGVPIAGIDWRMTEIDVRSIAGNLEVLQEAFAQSGVGKIEVSDDLEAQILDSSTPIGGHHLGAARMSDDPKSGVVDADLKAHGVTNLYVTGPAVLPTSSQANPTLTILALTLRLADHLKAASA